MHVDIDKAWEVNNKYKTLCFACTRKNILIAEVSLSNVKRQKERNSRATLRKRFGLCVEKKNGDPSKG